MTTDDLACPELIKNPGKGRSWTSHRRVRLSDLTPGGRLRLDAIGRYLQDVSADDTDDAPDFAGAWVVRRTVIAVHRGCRYLEPISLVTWGSGIGRSWAERRITVAGTADAGPDNSGDGSVAAAHIEGSTLWVHIDPERGRPAPLPDGFNQFYGAAHANREVSARLRHPKPSPDAVWTPWQLRATDFDLQSHVNNAAYWHAVEQHLADTDTDTETGDKDDGWLRHGYWAEMEHRDELAWGATPEIAVDTGPTALTVWFRYEDKLRASAVVRPLPAP